jgi:hypothetical protein
MPLEDTNYEIIRSIGSINIKRIEYECDGSGKT